MTSGMDDTDRSAVADYGDVAVSMMPSLVRAAPIQYQHIYKTNERATEHRQQDSSRRSAADNLSSFADKSSKPNGNRNRGTFHKNNTVDKNASTTSLLPGYPSTETCQDVLASCQALGLDRYQTHYSPVRPKHSTHHSVVGPIGQTDSPQSVTKTPALCRLRASCPNNSRNLYPDLSILEQHHQRTVILCSDTECNNRDPGDTHIHTCGTPVDLSGVGLGYVLSQISQMQSDEPKWVKLEEWMSRLEHCRRAIRRRTRCNGSRDGRSPAHKRCRSSREVKQIRLAVLPEIICCIQGIDGAWKDLTSGNGPGDELPLGCRHRASELLAQLVDVLTLYPSNADTQAEVMSCVDDICKSTPELFHGIMDTESVLRRDMIATVCRAMDRHRRHVRVQSAVVSILYGLLPREADVQPVTAVLFTELCRYGSVVMCLNVMDMFSRLQRGYELDALCRSSVDGNGQGEDEDASLVVTSIAQCASILDHMYITAQEHLVRSAIRREQSLLAQRQSCPSILAGDGVSSAVRDIGKMEDREPACRRDRNDKFRVQSHSMDACIARHSGNTTTDVDICMTVYARLVVLRLAEWIGEN